MALKPLLVKIGADTTQLERGLNRAGRSIAGLAKAAGAAGVLVAGALAAMTTQGLAAVDAQTKLARSLDGSANSLRAVQIAAGYAGVSVGEANTAMQQLNRELERAKEEGSPAADALKKLGLQANDLAGLDVDDRMALLADRINAMGLSSGQASDILRDLGIRSRNMALLLIQGGDAIRSARQEVTQFGLELTKAQTDSIESANDSIARMGLVFEGLRNRLAVEVAPTLKTVADRFNTLAQSDAVQTAIQSLAGAFGDLAKIILSEDFIQVAIDGLTGLANISASVASGIVTLSQNVEIVTLAFSGLAIAVAAAGGPLTVVAGLLALALGGIAAWRSKAEDMETSTYDARDALDELNASMGIVPGSAEAAGRSAVDLANDNYTLAESALAAAEAELAKRRAMREEGAVPGGVRGPSRARLFEAEDEAEATLAEAEAALAAARRRIENTVFGGVSGSNYGDNVAPPIELEPIVITPEDIDTGGGTAGLSTAEQLREQLEQRLEVLTQGLLTEREAVDMWHAEGMALLDEALKAEIIKQAEYNEQKERLEKEHQKRINAIKQAGAAADLATVAGAGAEILNAIGQNNEKALKAAKVFSAAQGLINTYLGASQALADPTLTTFQKFAAAASVIAQGIGFVNAIRSVNDNGSGGGGGGSTGASSAAAAPAIPTQTVAINLQGDTFSRSSVEGLLEQIQSQLDRGGRLVFS